MTARIEHRHGERREAEEAAILRRLESGETTLSVYGWQ